MELEVEGEVAGVVEEWKRRGGRSHRIAGAVRCGAVSLPWRRNAPPRLAVVREGRVAGRDNVLCGAVLDGQRELQRIRRRKAAASVAVLLALAGAAVPRWPDPAPAACCCCCCC